MHSWPNTQICHWYCPLAIVMFDRCVNLQIANSAQLSKFYWHNFIHQTGGANLSRSIIFSLLFLPVLGSTKIKNVHCNVFYVLLDFNKALKSRISRFLHGIIVDIYHWPTLCGSISQIKFSNGTFMHLKWMIDWVSNLECFRILRGSSFIGSGEV